VDEIMDDKKNIHHCGLTKIKYVIRYLMIFFKRYSLLDEFFFIFIVNGVGKYHVIYICGYPLIVKLNNTLISK